MANPSNEFARLDFYLQAYRLHQRMTRAANDQTRQLLDQIPDFARGQGLYAFTVLNAKLNGWMPMSSAEAALAQVRDEIDKSLNPDLMGHPGLAAAVTRVNGLNDGSSLDDVLNAIMLFRAAMAVALDDQDFDNLWSYGTTQLYDGDTDGAHTSYGLAQTMTLDLDAPNITKNSLRVDRADRKYFIARFAEEDEAVPEGITDAIQMIKDSIFDAKLNAPEDSKWHRWNWSLGWAYYEAYEYAQSLAALLQIQKPHDLIVKNIIASYAGLGEWGKAIPLAADFLSRNPDYTLDLENGWPYRHARRRKRWKQHLSDAGLPGTVS